MKKNTGFTLVELLAVVLIVAILTAVALPQYRNVIEKAHMAEAESMVRTIYDSSERLAGESGYRSYAALAAAKGTTNYSYARMDMFDPSNLPGKCTLTSGGTELNCPPYFRYKPLVSANGTSYVAAEKMNNPYSGTLIVLDRNTQQMYCQNPAGNNEVCDIFGLDSVSGITY